MKRNFKFLAFLLLALAGPRGLLAQDRLQLEEVLRAATAKPQLEEVQVTLAEGQLRLLQKLSKARFEFRPNLSLLSFSNPTLLALSLGSGLIFRRGSESTDFAVLNAHLDLLAAKLEQEHARVRKQTEAIHLFFDLIEKQQITEAACNSAQQMKTRLAEFEKLVQVSKLTAIEQVRHEEATLDRQVECVQAETQQQLAALHLASVIGLQSSSGSLRATEPEWIRQIAARSLPSLDTLLKIALKFRPEPQLLHKEISSLEKALGHRSHLLPESFSLGYQYVKDSSILGGTTNNGFLLGGNVIRPDVSWHFPLGATGERADRQAFLAAKLGMLEFQRADVQKEIRDELETLHILAAGHQARLALAQQRKELSSRRQQMTLVRFQHGLAAPAVLFDIEQESWAAQRAFSEALYAWEASVSSMYVLCGSEAQSEGNRALMIAAIGFRDEARIKEIFDVK